MRRYLKEKYNSIRILKHEMLMILTMACLVLLASCGSDEDKLDGLPWSNKTLFDATYTIDENGYCLQNDAKPLSLRDLEKVIVGYRGWQPVGIYEVKSNGKLSTSDYRDGIEAYSPRIYQFLSDSEMKTYYQDAKTKAKCFRKHDWSYEENRGIIFKDEKSSLDKSWRYMQVLGVKTSDGQEYRGESSNEGDTYLYVLEKVGEQESGDEQSSGNKQAKPIYALVVYKQLTTSETNGIVNSYQQDMSDKEDVKVPEDCQFHIRCSYVNSEDGFDYYHSKFQSFRQLRLELTDEKGNNSSTNPYYQYFDSIVWTCNGMPDRFVSLRNVTGRHEVAYHFSTYFFHVNTDNKLTMIEAQGYKGGRVVYIAGTGITIWNQQGFLGYDFSSSDLQNPTNPNEDLYCIFDQGKCFRLLSPYLSPEYPDSPYSELRSIVTSIPSDEDSSQDGSSLEKALEKEKKELVDLMDSYYGMYDSYEGSKHVVVDETNKEKYRKRFKALPKDADIWMYWNGGTPSSSSGYAGCHVAMILHQDKENPQKSYYYIHAEPKK